MRATLKLSGDGFPFRRSDWALGRPRNAKALRRAVVGLIASVGAFLAFGMSPLATAPPAHADILDSIIDPVINSLAGVDPTLGADMTGWLANLDPALAAASSVDTSSLAGAATAESSSLGALSTDVGSATSTANPFDAWLHGLEQDWINSSLGQQVDTALNDWFKQADPSAVAANTGAAGECGLICNGANGLPGTGENGQGGGLLLGDGGAVMAAIRGCRGASAGPAGTAEAQRPATAGPAGQAVIPATRLTPTAGPAARVD
jgi:hypothetical protein